MDRESEEGGTQMERGNEKDMEAVGGKEWCSECTPYFACHRPIRRAPARRAHEEQRWPDLHRIIQAGLSPERRHYRRKYICASYCMLSHCRRYVLLTAYITPCLTNMSTGTSQALCGGGAT